jgi:hypothetical protein
MFTKLKNSFVVDQYSAEDVTLLFNVGSEDDFKGIRINNVSSPFISKLLDVIPEQFRNKFGISLMTINSSFPPHIDALDLKCAINFYVQPSECITTFYKTKTGSQLTTDNLIELDHFVAEPGEAYVLDVTKPHGVTQTSNADRVAIRISTKAFSYEQVCGMLKATGNL